jgi:glycosyltransferase involved in cell wall biosynthesis
MVDPRAAAEDSQPVIQPASKSESSDQNNVRPRRVLVNGFGAYLGGIVRVHNEICRAVGTANMVFVANAPRDQDAATGVKILTKQSGSRALSFLRDAFASLRLMKFDVRIDSAPGFRFFTRATRHVVVVHDMNFLRPDVHRISRKQQLYRQLLHRWTLARVDRIVVVSEATRAEVCAFEPRVAAKIVVLPLPVDYMGAYREPAALAPATEPVAGRRGDEVRLLSFGHARNKGVDRLLGLLASDQKYRLTVICPASIWNDEWQQFSDRYGVSDRVTVKSGLSDSQLTAEYLAADVFCMVSKYEGYGLPVAEALYLGQPTVISDLDVLRSTSRGMAMIVHGDGPDALAAAIESALSQPAEHWERARALFQAHGWQEWAIEMLAGG